MRALLTFPFIVLGTQNCGILQICLSSRREWLDVISLKIGPSQLASTLFTDTFVCGVPQHAPLLRTEGSLRILALEDSLNQATENVVTLPAIGLCIGPLPNCLKILTEQLLSGR